MTDHPIAPSLELVQQWTDEIYGGPGVVAASDDICLAKLAAQWGADQELEACCEWLDREGWSGESRQLRAARRLKPQMLAEQGMEALRSTPCTEQRHYDALFAALVRLKQLEDSNV